MGFTIAVRNAMLANEVRSDINQLSLHTADPGNTGADEYSHEDYNRAAITTASDLSGVDNAEFTLLNDKTFEGGADAEITHIGVWDNGTFLGGGPITGDTNFNSEGEFIIKAGTSFELE